MNKFILMILAVCAFQGAFAFDVLTHKENLGSPIDHGFSFSSIDELSEIAKNVVSFSKKKQPVIYTTTDVVTVVLDNGVTAHIAAYDNGQTFVLTALDGQEVGKQIMYNEARGVFGLTYNAEWKKDHFIHKY